MLELRQREEPATEIYTFDASTNTNLLQPQDSKSRFDDLVDQYASNSLPGDEIKTVCTHVYFSFNFFLSEF